MNITRQDIEAKANEIVSVFDDTKEAAKDKAMVGALVVAAVVVTAFVLGRRRGRGGKKTLVEVYRV